MKRLLSSIKNDLSSKYLRKNKKHSLKEFNIIKELNTHGVSIVPNFLKNPEKYITKIESHLNHPKCWKDKHESDFRLNGIDKIDESFKKIFDDKIIRNLYELYVGKLNESYVMANKTLFKKSNLGSGGGWHKDNISRQLKFMVYLNDVDSNNGAFEYLEKTNRIYTKIKIDFLNNGMFGVSNRIKKVDDLKNNYKIKLAAAKAGDLIIFDSSGIHRGKPIKKGFRYAVTLYSNKFNFNENVKNKWLNQN